MCSNFSLLLLTFIFSLSAVCVSTTKVQLGLYYESLCPDSRRFITNQLTPTFNDLSQIFDIELVPFGNSNWTYNTTTRDVLFECQHGLNECLGNRIQHLYKKKLDKNQIFQSCLITMVGNDTKFSLKFIDCMFRSHKWTKPEITGKNCSHQFGVDWTALYHCSTGPYSTILQLEMSNKTVSLKPPQNWIPWVTIDGKHDDNIQTLAETDLQKLICDSYREEKPIECKRKAKYESFPIGRYVQKDGVIEP